MRTRRMAQPGDPPTIRNPPRQPQVGSTRHTRSSWTISTASSRAGCRGLVDVFVSCVMPTFNRRRFVPDAIENFRLQTYADRELVIIDDGTDPVADLVAGDDRIRYVR